MVVVRVCRDGEEGVTADGHEVSLWGYQNILKLVMVMVSQFYEYIKNHWIGHLRLHFTVCKLYLYMLFRNILSLVYQNRTWEFSKRLEFSLIELSKFYCDQLWKLKCCTKNNATLFLQIPPPHTNWSIFFPTGLPRGFTRMSLCPVRVQCWSVSKNSCSLHLCSLRAFSVALLVS